LEELSSRLVTLRPGQSRTVNVVFNVENDVRGAQTFTIEADVDGEVVTQDVEVSFPTGTSGITGFAIGEGNTLLWVIGAINVILIILIIVVAVRFARR